MRDISAREAERTQHSRRREVSGITPAGLLSFRAAFPSTAYGSPGDEMRLFLTEDGYQSALQSQQRREIKIKRYARVIEGHILDFKPENAAAHKPIQRKESNDYVYGKGNSKKQSGGRLQISA